MPRRLRRAVSGLRHRPPRGHVQLSHPSARSPVERTGMTVVGNHSALTIAVDAMGGEHAPGAIVDGACLAVAEIGCRVLLVGDEAAIQACLPNGVPEGVEIRAATQVIGMADEPSA